MKVGKIIGRVALGALALSVVPYQFKKDEETGSIEVRSLLWALKKTPHGEGEDKDHYTFELKNPRKNLPRWSLPKPPPKRLPQNNTKPASNAILIKFAKAVFFPSREKGSFFLPAC